eukprot:RCo044661
MSSAAIVPFPWEVEMDPASMRVRARMSEKQHAEWNCVFAPAFGLRRVLDFDENIVKVCDVVSRFLRWLPTTRCWCRLRLDQVLKHLRVLRKFFRFIFQRRRALLSTMLKFWTEQEEEEMASIRKLSARGEAASEEFSSQLNGFLSTCIPEDMKRELLRGLYRRKLAKLSTAVNAHLTKLHQLRERRRAQLHAIVTAPAPPLEQLLLGGSMGRGRPFGTSAISGPQAVLSKLLQAQTELMNRPPKLNFDPSCISYRELKQLTKECLQLGKPLDQLPPPR